MHVVSKYFRFTKITKGSLSAQSNNIGNHQLPSSCSLCFFVSVVSKYFRVTKITKGSLSAQSNNTGNHQLPALCSFCFFVSVVSKYFRVTKITKGSLSAQRKNPDNHQLPPLCSLCFLVPVVSKNTWSQRSRRVHKVLKVIIQETINCPHSVRCVLNPLPGISFFYPRYSRIELTFAP